MILCDEITVSKLEPSFDGGCYIIAAILVECLWTIQKKNTPPANQFEGQMIRALKFYLLLLYQPQIPR